MARLKTSSARFSVATLEKFEAASASIPMRQLDRAFDGGGIRLGNDPGGPDGTRRVQFRRYVASIDQDDPHQLDRLGAVLGALIGEVATSKQPYLIEAAAGDGFVFANGAFAPASADDAIASAKELLESTCRTVLQRLGKPAPAKTAGLAEIVAAALAAVRVR